MTKPASVRRAAAEADRILAELNAKPGETAPARTDAPDASTPDTQTSASDSAAAAVAQAPAPTPPAASHEDDFKTKYDVLRNKYDAEVPSLQATLAEQAERTRQLEKMIADLAAKQAPVRAEETFNLVKPEEITEYGKDFFDVVGRRARETVSPELAELRKKVTEMESRFGTQAEQAKQKSKTEVFASLNTRVPNWQQLNVDPKFLAWLSQEDVLSGRQRKELLTEAFEGMHAERVVGFFEKFLKEDSGSVPSPSTAAPQTRQPQVSMDSLVAPGSTRQSAPVAPGEKRTWTEAEISDVYARRRRRQIPDAEFAKLEQEMMLAVAEGRVQ
jgi:hypothetical protein